MNSQGSAWMAMGGAGVQALSGGAHAAPAASPRVLIAGEDALARTALAARLAATPYVSLAGDLPAAALQAGVVEHEPDVVLWDLGMQPGPVLASLRGWDGGVPVLALSDGSAADVLAAGAQGVLPRDADPARLAAALQALAQGLWVLDDRAAAALLRPALPLPEEAEALTPREQEVVALLAQGLSNRAIAERLGISDHTAKFHVNAILGKLGATTRTDAVMRAVRLGLILV